MSEVQNAWVVRVLGVTPSPPAPQQSTGAVSYAKSRLTWLAMRKRIDTEVDDFIGSVAEQYEDEGNDQVVRELLRARLAPVLATFDDTLADTLDAATNETDPGRRRQLVGDARAIIERYQAFIAGDDLFAAMDSNPFAPTAIQKTMVTTLQALSTALR